MTWFAALQDRSMETTNWLLVIICFELAGVIALLLVITAELA